MLLVDAGNTFIKWALTHSGQSFPADGLSWKEFGTVRHHELSSLKGTWQALHRKSPFDHVIISNVAGQNLGNALFDFLKTLQPRPQKIEWFYSAPSLAGIRNTYLDYRKLGSDRFASMVGAQSPTPRTATDCRYCRHCHHYRRHITRRNIYGWNDSARPETDGGIPGTKYGTAPRSCPAKQQNKLFCQRNGKCHFEWLHQRTGRRDRKSRH